MELPDIAGTVRAELARQRKPQNELQERLGISRASMYRRMTGDAHFDARELVIIADFLGLAVGELFSAPSAEAESRATVEAAS